MTEKELDQERKGYDGTDRMSWKDEATILHDRLRQIEALARATHDCVVFHIEEDRNTKVAVDELITLWKGSKIMVAAFKVLIPIVVGIVGAAVWAREHFSWKF